MVFKQFTMPPDTLAVGTPNPPIDADNIIDALNALGASFSPLNTQYGVCDPGGINDSTAGINSALSAATNGQRCILVAGIYKTTSSIIVPPGVTLQGDFADKITTHNDFLWGTTIQPAATWSSTTVGSNTWYGAVNFLGQTVPTPNYATTSEEQKVIGIHIDCSNVPSSTLIDGFQHYGFARRTLVQHCTVSYCTGNGFNYVNDASGNGADAPTVLSCNVRNSTLAGFVHNRISDARYFDCMAEDCGNTSAGGNDGWTITNASNGKFTNCRAEHCGFQGVGNGFTYIARSNITGSGGCVFVGCSTDRNEGYGYLIESTNSQATTVIFSGCNARRDGRNNNTGGGGLAGWYITAHPSTVIMSGCNTFPGVDDDGTGTNSPQIGLKIASNGGTAFNAVMLSGCSFHGNTTGISDDGSTTLPVCYSGVIQATGSTSSPTVSAVKLNPTFQQMLGIFGSGNDGGVALDGTVTPTWASKVGSVYTLTRDVQLTSMSILNGVTLNTANFRIYCQGTVTVNVGGILQQLGNNASGSTAGASSGAGASLQGSGAGGAGGTGVNGTGASGSAANFGNTGGNGGAGTSGAAGSGGAVSAANNTTATNNILTTPIPIIQGGAFWNNANRGIQWGAGGGGGGSDSSSNAGGGGGSGGGIISIMAWAIINNGTISVAGGNGANGTAGNAGGGGGGAGGLIIGFTLVAWTAGTMTVTGGTKGTHAGTGSDGVNGGAGLALNVVLE